MRGPDVLFEVQLADTEASEVLTRFGEAHTIGATRVRRVITLNNVVFQKRTLQLSYEPGGSRSVR
jgi:hypothetical protein